MQLHLHAKKGWERHEYALVLLVIAFPQYNLRNQCEHNNHVFCNSMKYVEKRNKTKQQKRDGTLRTNGIVPYLCTDIVVIAILHETSPYVFHPVIHFYDADFCLKIMKWQNMSINWSFAWSMPLPHSGRLWNFRKGNRISVWSLAERMIPNS